MEVKNIDAVVAIILNDENEVLLQKKDLRYKWFPGEWCMFGGGIRENEEPEEALKRE